MMNEDKIKEGRRNVMGYWNSRGLRGSHLEEEINITNELYSKKKLGLIQKIPTPIKPVTIDKRKGTITLAYFDQKSTVDYIGVIQGVPICFDAKETTQKSLPIANIHMHQIEFMKEFQLQNGIAFIIVYFRCYDEYYLLPFDNLYQHWFRAQEGGRKSIPYVSFPKKYKIKKIDGIYVHYLEPLKYIV